MNDEVEILIVEDNPTDLEMTLRSLRRQNVANRIVALRDGAEALQYFFGDGDRVRIPKVILLDLKLPKVDGIAVLKKLKSEESTRRIPVVVLTSSTEERDRLASYDLGANSFIVKPVEFDSFSRAIAEVGLYWVVLNRPPAA